MSQRFTEGLAGILFYGLRKNMLVSKLMGHKEQEIWVEYESETKTVYGQPLYYKLFTMCQRKHTHKNHSPQERDRGEGGKKALQTGRDFFSLPWKTICSEAACTPAAFHSAHRRCFIFTTLLAFLFSSPTVLIFCFVISSMSFITKDTLSTGTLVPRKEMPMQIWRMLRECEN